MSESCETCKHVDVDASAEPCSFCKNNYISMWEPPNYTELTAQLKKLAKAQVNKGNTEAVDVCAAVLKWIKEEA